MRRMRSIDRSQTHIVGELTEYGRRLVAPRRIHVSIENEPQDTSFVRQDDEGPGVDGMWNEDWHHAAFVALTGRREAYFTDYRGTANEFASMARRNLLYQGQWYSWQKQPRGSDGSQHPHAAFTCFLENHDQVANTGTGSRLHQFVDRAKWRAMSTLLLLGPGVPLLFQGQEEAIDQPFTVLRRSPASPCRRGAQRAAGVSVAVPFAIVVRDPGASCRSLGPEVVRGVSPRLAQDAGRRGGPSPVHRPDRVAAQRSSVVETRYCGRDRRQYGTNTGDRAASL